MIPENFDHIAALDELNAMGWKDAKIENVCGMTVGHVSNLRRRRSQSMRYEDAARLINFLLDERMKRARCAA